jgi:hypothetical protein
MAMFPVEKKHHAVFPSAELASRHIKTYHPELAKSFSKSGVRGCLRRSQTGAGKLSEEYSLGPFMSLLEHSPSTLLRLSERWFNSIRVIDFGSHSPGVMWSENGRSGRATTPFFFDDWLRFVSGRDVELSDDEDTTHVAELNAGLALGLSHEVSDALAFEDRWGVTSGVPLLALAVSHLGLDVPAARRMRYVFNLYATAVWEDEPTSNVYDALSYEIVSLYQDLCTEVNGVVEDVPLWLAISALTMCDRAEITSLMSSRVDPIEVVRHWAMGFTLSSAVQIVSNDIDVPLAATVFPLRDHWTELLSDVPVFSPDGFPGVSP